MPGRLLRPVQLSPTSNIVLNFSSILSWKKKPRQRSRSLMLYFPQWSTSSGLFQSTEKLWCGALERLRWHCGNISLQQLAHQETSSWSVSDEENSTLQPLTSSSFSHWNQHQWPGSTPPSFLTLPWKAAAGPWPKSWSGFCEQLILTIAKSQHLLVLQI